MTRPLLRHLAAMLALVLAAAVCWPPAAARAETAAEAYQRLLRERAQVARVRFRDDPTDVAGKAYEFGKALLDAFGVPGNVLDAADLARALKNDGPSWQLAGTTLAKALASNVPTGGFQKVVEGLERRELLEIARLAGIASGDDIAESTETLQRLVVDYLDSGPGLAGRAAGGEAGAAAVDVFIDVLGRVCKTCSAAYRAYDLAVEAATAAEIAFENEMTQAMFGQIAKADWYRADEFLPYYTGNPALQTEARRALEAAWAAAGRSGKPTEDEVLRYVFQRYQQWRAEIAGRRADADLLAKAQGFYEKLLGYEKRDMYGEGSEADWAARWMADFVSLWNDLTALRGDAPWPFGLGEGAVRHEVAELLRRWRTAGLTDAQVSWEIRRLAAGWGWIAKDRVGPPPPPPLPPPPPRVEDRAALETRVVARLTELDYAKLAALFQNAGIAPSRDFYECLCNGYGGDFHYHPEPEAGAVCGRMGPLGGMTWVGFHPGAYPYCISAHRLPDGRTIAQALADRIEQIRGAPSSRP